MKQKSKVKFDFWRNEKGSAAMFAAMVVPALIGFGVLAVDVGHFYTLKTNMQQASDLAALSVLTRMRNDERLVYISAADAATKYAEMTAKLSNQNMPRHAKSDAVRSGDVTFGNWDFNNQIFSADPDVRPTNAVRIKAEMSEDRDNPATTFFGKIFTSHVDVSVSSMAVMPLPKSVLVLSPNADGALTVLDHSADLDAETVHVNSASETAFVAPSESSQMGGAAVYVKGGLVGKTDKNKYITGSEAAPDLLKGVLPVDYTDWPCINNPAPQNSTLVLKLKPGRYCNGLTITSAFEVIFEKDGTYVIEGGPLVLSQSLGSRPVKGERVLIYLADGEADAQINGGEIFLTAKEEGPHAGIVIMAAPGLAPGPRISFDDSSVYLAGILYAPNSNVSARASNIRGACDYVCFVSATLKLDTTLVSLTPGNVGEEDIHDNRLPKPVNPPALMKNFRPYILTESSETTH